MKFNFFKKKEKQPKSRDKKSSEEKLPYKKIEPSKSESEKLLESKIEKSIHKKEGIKPDISLRVDTSENVSKINSKAGQINKEIDKINLEKKKQKKKHDPEKIKRKKFTKRGFAKILKLDEHLEKSGLGKLDADKVTTTIFKIDFMICILATLIFAAISIISNKGFDDLFVFLLGFWLTVFPLLLALIWVGFFVYIDLKIFNRTRQIEEVFPDFLQLTSANISAGMPIDKALWYAVRPGFGVLAKEIEEVAKNTMAGEDLSEALTKFSKKYDSKTIQRSVSLLLEGLGAGGKIADLLSKISLNIEETKILKKEMAANVTTYVIFISFASIIAAPALFGLSTQLLVIIKGITANMSGLMTSSSSFFSFAFSADGVKTADFTIFSYVMLAITAFFSAIIVTVIQKGRVKEGWSKIPIYIVISAVIYTISNIVMGSFLGGII